MFSILYQEGEDHYEDMGGHHLHESHLDDYIKDFLENHLTKDELTELMGRLKGDL